MRDYPIRHVLVRHEQNGGHAADGYARASGKVGVAMGTSGPGATNLVTAIATAMLDSIPVVFITGQVPSGLIGSDAFQETDVTGVTLPITKHNALVMRVQDIAPALNDAFHIARSGRPGPVLVDIPKDVQLRKIDFVYSDAEPVHLSRHRPAKSPAAGIAKAIELIDAAERPVILAGHGVLLSGATEELRALVERTGIPVALTLLGLDALPPGHPSRLAMMGMHGEAYVNTAIQEADLLVALGMRFDDRVTGDLRSYARIRIAAERGYPVEEQVITRDQLYMADELFVCGTAAEVVALREVDGRRIGAGSNGARDARPPGGVPRRRPRARRALRRVAPAGAAAAPGRRPHPVTAPSLAEETRRAYFAKTPDG
jgi:thiamine pyrophosphate-dependent acetolactate synthase large subunit-like protein